MRARATAAVTRVIASPVNRSALYRPEPREYGAVENDRQPEHELKRRLAGLVPHQLLRNQRTGPAAEQPDDEERVLRRSTPAGLRRGFVRPVECKRGEASGHVHHRNRRRKFTRNPESAHEGERSEEHTSELQSLAY